MAVPNLPPGFDFTDPDIYAQRLPTEELAELRRAAPIWWNEQPPDVGGFGDGGFWVVSKHRDVREVSLRSDVFSSAKKSIVPRYKVTGGGGQIEAGALSMIMMDDPEHTRLRKIISRGFTPRAVERLRAELGERAQRIAADAAGEGSGDFVLQVARELPLQAIAGLLGVPLEDRDKLFDWTNKMIGDDDPEFAEYDALGSTAELIWYAMQLAARKAEEPGDDIVSTLIDSEADGQLTEAEFGLNADGGCGAYDHDFRPLGCGISTAEKTFQTYFFTTHNPGGHIGHGGRQNCGGGHPLSLAVSHWCSDVIRDDSLPSAQNCPNARRRHRIDHWPLLSAPPRSQPPDRRGYRRSRATGCVR